jgi:hypothetical protein
MGFSQCLIAHIESFLRLNNTFKIISFENNQGLNPKQNNIIKLLKLKLQKYESIDRLFFSTLITREVIKRPTMTITKRVAPAVSLINKYNR